VVAGRWCDLLILEGVALSDTLDVWDDARDAARQFWVRGSEDARVSDDVRTICASNAQLLARNRHPG
jgi:hypothetical protein